MQNKSNNDLNNMAKKANINVNELKQYAQNGKIDDFIDKKLSPDASKKLKQVLSDKAATEKLLSTPQAKELLNKFMKK